VFYSNRNVRGQVLSYCKQKRLTVHAALTKLQREEKGKETKEQRDMEARHKEYVTGYTIVIFSTY
jgi:hypothetical protein